MLIIIVESKLTKTQVNSLIEVALIRHALPKRINDKFCEANKDKTTNKTGIYINYALPEENYAALIIDNAEMKIGVKESENIFQEQIQNDLQNLGLKTPHHFKIIEIN